MARVPAPFDDLFAGTPHRPKRKNVSRELPVHRECLAYLRVALPGAAINHSPNGFHVPMPPDLPPRWRAFFQHATAREMAKLKTMGAVSGWPDLMVIHQGRAMAFEIKAEKGRASEDQDNALRQLAANGALVAVVRSAADCQAALERWGVPISARVA